MRKLLMLLFGLLLLTLPPTQAGARIRTGAGDNNPLYHSTVIRLPFVFAGNVFMAPWFGQDVITTTFGDSSKRASN